MKTSLVVVIFAVGACHAAPTSNVTPSPASSASSASSASLEVPIEARFADLPLHVARARACDRLRVAVTSGHATARGHELGVGDVLETWMQGDYDVTGAGVVVFATEKLTCDGIPKPTERVILASAAPELTWASGAMHAHLDDVGPSAYFGRLEGTASVAEHVHETSWEILCGIEASGAFTLAGKPQRLGSRTCVSVPPSTKHAWTPDPGTKLVAVQFYDPPGPEQRFKKLASGK